MEEVVDVYLVERTFSDDELNLLILTYATPDGTGIFRVERAIPLLGNDEINIPTRRTVSRSNLMVLSDNEEADGYRRQVKDVRDCDPKSQTNKH